MLLETSGLEVCVQPRLYVQFVQLKMYNERYNVVG